MFLTIILVIALVGVLLWAINNFLPMQSQAKNLLNLTAILLVVLWILKLLGVFHYLAQQRIL